MTETSRVRQSKRTGLHEVRLFLDTATLGDVARYAHLDGNRSIRSAVESVLKEGIRRRLRAAQLEEREARKRQAREDAAKSVATVELVADDTPEQIADVDG